MTSEQNVPEVQSHQGSTASTVQQDGDAQFTGQNVPHGMGQSKSSRRRRRKRKTKGADAPQGAQMGDDQAAGQPVGSIQASSSQPQAFQPQGQQSQGGSQQNNSGGKRWKKKFRDRDRQRPAQQQNPGNVASFEGSSGGSFRDGSTHQPGNNT